jgi:hypothetical protein
MQPTMRSLILCAANKLRAAHGQVGTASLEVYLEVFHADEAPNRALVPYYLLDHIAQKIAWLVPPPNALTSNGGNSVYLNLLVVDDDDARYWTPPEVLGALGSAPLPPLHPRSIHSPDAKSASNSFLS